ncbi:MAG: 4Fe-4S binding protein [Planctomycetota bacterium]|nr:4Fe-4S binding protein [Planctomycetota bacterium]
MDKKPGWKDIPIGGKIVESGNAHSYVTGGWRTYRPVYNAENCIQCMSCFYYCPDSSILAKDGKVTGVDYDHCKGCGVCARECPVNKREMKKPEGERKLAIEMELDSD